MESLFSYLANEGLFQNWAETFDWLFDDHRFAVEKGWEKGQIGKFTKKVKRFPNFSKENFACGRVESLNLSELVPRNQPIVMMCTASSEGRDLIRHIRNGIAHGRTKLLKQGNETYIEIKDYGKAETTGGSKQTAYICIPLSYIPKMFKVYDEIEKAKKSDHSKSKLKTKELVRL